MTTEPAVLPPPTGGPAAPLPPPGLAAAPAGVPPVGPFLPAVVAPGRPSAPPRPAAESAVKAPFAVVAPGPDVTAPPSWKQAQKRSSFGRILRMVLVACLVVGAGLGVYAYTQRSDDSDLPVAELQPAEPSNRLPGQQAIDDARAVTGQAGGVVTTDGRAAFTTEEPPLSNSDFQQGLESGLSVTGYTVQGPDYVMVMVMHSPTSMMATPETIADSMASYAGANVGVTVTASSEIPVAAGKAFSYQLTGDGAAIYLRVLIADDTAVAVFGFADNGSEPADVGSIWNTITFDGVSIT